jgi:hypothetical protein
VSLAEWVSGPACVVLSGYPSEHADSGKVARPANFFCGRRPNTVGPASLTADLVFAPPGRAGIHLPWGNLLAPISLMGIESAKVCTWTEKTLVVAACKSPPRSGVPDQPLISLMHNDSTKSSASPSRVSSRGRRLPSRCLPQERTRPSNILMPIGSAKTIVRE